MPWVKQDFSIKNGIVEIGYFSTDEEDFPDPQVTRVIFDRPITVRDGETVTVEYNLHTGDVKNVEVKKVEDNGTT